MHKEAVELNEIIKKHSSIIYDLLSEKGKNIFFPKKGILGQTADAKGKKINATIGSAYEDDGTPMRLESIDKNINLDPALTFPYAPSFGRPDIRARWKEMIYAKNPGLKNKPISLPVVSSALTHGLSMMGYMFVDKEDKILIPNLYWGNYNLIFKNAYDASFETFNFFNGDKLDIEALKNALMSGDVGKKILLLNFPNNPTGYTPTINEAKEIKSIVEESAKKGNKIIILCDDAYFGLVYEDGIEKESLFTNLADLHENVLAIKLDGPTKEDYVWGFRVGFITYGIKGGVDELYSALEAKTSGAIRGSISNVSNLSQSILLASYNDPNYNSEKIARYNLLKSRYLKVKKVLNENSNYKEYFSPLPFNSGYFMCVKLNEELDGEKIRNILLSKYDIGIINMSNLFRVAFSAVQEKYIEELFENMYLACKESCE